MESQVNQISHLIAQICSPNNIKVNYVWLNLGYVFGLWEQRMTTLVQIASVIFILVSQILGLFLHVPVILSHPLHVHTHMARHSW